MDIHQSQDFQQVYAHCSHPIHDDQLLELGQFLGKEPYKDVKLAEHLTLSQKKEVEKLLWEYQDIFSDMPGMTH